MYLIDSNILIYYLGANDKAVHFIQTPSSTIGNFYFNRHGSVILSI